LDGECRPEGPGAGTAPRTSSGSSRRSFLLAGAPALTGAWLAANWPTIVAAAAHSHNVAVTTPEAFSFLTPAEIADLDALTAQIVPSGKSIGAREAHVTHFIDHSLASFFSWRAPAFRAGLAHFQADFRGKHPDIGAFAKASSQVQIDYLKTVDTTEFFAAARLLTLLGMFSSPQYGGNFGGTGWKMLGFVDEHVFSPPFGYYDARYEGFVPYTGKHT
jgi:gluconate 2-dehydrogenase gamma chain